MDEYARSYGHEPTDNWILVVHPDDSSEFVTFDDPGEMWCCARGANIRAALKQEVAATADECGELTNKFPAPVHR